MTTMLKRFEIRRRGDTEGFDLLLDGEVLPFQLERTGVVVNTISDAPLLYSCQFGIFAEEVVGVEEFNEQLAEEADAARVRAADRRQAVVEEAMHHRGAVFHWPSSPDAFLFTEAEFKRMWEQ